ncbi:protein of unknown function [Petrocella atlantisensis]|uniref:Uncharacterized protein n=1 Tax=Petrocella atlantisensis TaxID=2173034 RepID=A0A3P7NXG0_9FIRM|nr:protein of unknown function [Petrocella atlantisensis]
MQLIDDISVDEVVSSFAEKSIGEIGQMDFSIGRWRSNKL